MLKKNIKPVLLAGALALATAVSPVLAKEVTSENPADLVIEKTFEYPDGTVDKNTTFNFSVEHQNSYKPGTGTNELGALYGAGETTPPSFNIVTPTGKTDYSLQLGTDTTNGTNKSFTVRFAAETSTLPGVYTYLIKETSAFNANNNSVDDINKNYDETTYLVKVRVVTPTDEEGNIDNNAQTVIDQIVFINNNNSTGDQVAKVEKARFVNYEQDYADLKITKTVKGSGADVNEQFRFTVKLTLSDFYKNHFKGNTNLVGENQAPMSFEVRLNGATIAIGEGINDDYNSSTQKLTFKSDGTATLDVDMNHGEDFTIKGLPVGTTYTIVETNANNYQTSYVTTFNNTSASSTENDDKEVSGNSDITTIYQGGNVVAFTNTKSSNPITGVIVNNMPYIALLGASGAGLVVLATSKKRSKK